LPFIVRAWQMEYLIM